MQFRIAAFISWVESAEGRLHFLFRWNHDEDAGFTAQLGRQSVSSWIWMVSPELLSQESWKGKYLKYEVWMQASPRIQSFIKPSEPSAIKRTHFRKNIARQEKKHRTTKIVPTLRAITKIEEEFFLCWCDPKTLKEKRVIKIQKAH